jgi:hypothetical protein
MTQPTDPFNCPVCDDCEHDQRTTVLEVTSVLMANLSAAGEELIDAMEEDGPAAEGFARAVEAYRSLQRQLDAVVEYVEEIALIKEVASR